MRLIILILILIISSGCRQIPTSECPTIYRKSPEELCKEEKELKCHLLRWKYYLGIIDYYNKEVANGR